MYESEQLIITNYPRILFYSQAIHVKAVPHLCFIGSSLPINALCRHRTTCGGMVSFPYSEFESCLKANIIEKEASTNIFARKCLPANEL